jgi:hypothetical protein
MCPECVASAAWIASSVMSTGGVAALALNLVRGKFRENGSGSKDQSKNETERRSNDGLGNDDNNEQM